MKQITSNTILIQADKSYPAIEVKYPIESSAKNQLYNIGIVWIDTNAEIEQGDCAYIKYSRTAGETFNRTGMYGKVPYVQKENGWVNVSLVQDGKVIEACEYNSGVQKIIAANFELENIPLINLKDEVDQQLVKKAMNQWVGNLSKIRLLPETIDKITEDNCFYYLSGYKANQANWTDEDIVKAFTTGKFEGINMTMIESKDYLKSLNEIKEITINNNFNVINYK